MEATAKSDKLEMDDGEVTPRRGAASAVVSWTTVVSVTLVLVLLYVAYLHVRLDRLEQRGVRCSADATQLDGSATNQDDDEVRTPLPLKLRRDRDERRHHRLRRAGQINAL